MESDDDDDMPSPFTTPCSCGSFAADDDSAKNVAIAESKLRKVLVRSSVGFVMVASFVGIVWAGHLYLSALVVLIQVRRRFVCRRIL